MIYDYLLYQCIPQKIVLEFDLIDSQNDYNSVVTHYQFIFIRYIKYTHIFNLQFNFES